MSDDSDEFTTIGENQTPKEVTPEIIEEMLKRCIGVRDNIFDKMADFKPYPVRPGFVIGVPKEIDWKCKKCGNCCITEIVEIRDKEIEKIREFTGRDDFWVRDETSITGFKMKREDFRCVFLDKNRRCSIYNIRPLLCQVYPFRAVPVEKDGRGFTFIIPKIGIVGNKITCNGFYHGKMKKKTAFKSAMRILNEMDEIWSSGK